MKFEFKRVHAKDFLSLGDVTFNFKDNIALLLGVNDDSSSSDDNGSGKSSLAEAVRWALYGETVRGAIDKTLPVDHVIREGCKEARVSVDLLVNGNPFTVERVRTRKGFNLAVEEGGTRHEGKAAQGVLNSILAINVVQFSNLVHLDGSYPDLFAPASDRTRKEILAELVDIAVVNQMQETVKSRLAPIDAEITEQSNKADRLRMIQSTSIRDSAESKERGVKSKERLDEAREGLTNAQLERALAKKAVTEGEEAVKRIRAKFHLEQKKAAEDVDNAQDNLTRVQNDLETLQTAYLMVDIEEAKKAIYSGKQSFNVLTQRIEEMEGLQAAGKCPICGQDTTEVGAEDIASLASQAKEIERDIAEQQKRLEELTEERDAALTAMRDKKQQWVSAIRELREEEAKVRKKADAAADEAERKLAEARKAYDQADRVVGKYEQAVSSYKAELKGLKETYLKAQDRADKAAEEIHKAEARMNTLHVEAQILEFWKKGFGPKGVPSLFIETVLPQITKRIQRYADILTGGDVIVTLKAYRETKSKTVQESIQISAVNSKGASVYGANSTGERNRIDLAVTLGLVEYFKDMNVFESNLLMCDEIFDGLDNTGVERALNALKQSDVRSVLVISHHDHLKPLFARTLIAHKANGTTNIKEEN